MEKFSRGIILCNYRCRFFFFLGGSHVQSSLLPKFAPGTWRDDLNVVLFEVPGGRHEAGAVLYGLALREALVHRRPEALDARDCFWALMSVGDDCDKRTQDTPPCSIRLVCSLVLPQ